MTLDEAIQHCKEKAKELSDKAYQEWGVSMTEEEAYDCNECAREHEQLAQWLKDYKRLLEERPHGKWNYIQSGMRVCPFCGAMPHKLYKNFCAKCGADMREDSEK